MFPKLRENTSGKMQVGAGAALANDGYFSFLGGPSLKNGTQLYGKRDMELAEDS